MCNLRRTLVLLIVVASSHATGGLCVASDRIAFTNNCPGRVVFYLRDDSSGCGYEAWTVPQGQSLILDLNPSARGPFSVILRNPHDDAFFMDHLDLRALINAPASGAVVIKAELRGYWYNQRRRIGRSRSRFQWIPQCQRKVADIMIGPQQDGPITIGTTCSEVGRDLPYPPPPPPPPPPPSKPENKTPAVAGVKYPER